jgi:hypothetical protein
MTPAPPTTGVPHAARRSTHFVDEVLESAEEHRQLLLVEVEVEPAQISDRVGSRFGELVAERDEHRRHARRVLRVGDVGGVAEAQLPRQTRRSVRLLVGATDPLPDADRLDQLGVDEHAQVVQDRRRVALEPIGELLVGPLPVAAEPHDSQSQRVGCCLDLRRGGIASGNRHAGTLPALRG